MAVSLQQRIDRIKSKAAVLNERYIAMSKARDDAERRVAERDAEIDGLRRQLAERDREIERLKVSNVLTPDHRQVEQTRQLISSLVRDIDKCIAQLSV